MVTTDFAMWKTLNRTRIVEGVSDMIQDGTDYIAGNVVTLHFPAARVERIMKATDQQISHRGISLGQYSNKDATTTVYDYKKRLWTWRVQGKYATTNYTNCHNFYSDARLMLDDGGEISLTLQDKTITVFPIDCNFTWEGGVLHTVAYTIDFVEGYPR